MAKIALLIGVSEYSDPSLTPLPAATKDVQAIQTVLDYPEMGNFDEVCMLTNPERQQVEDGIESLFRGRQKEDLILLYFSGHGIKDDSGRLYFATCDTRKNEKGELIRSRAVAASFIHEVMNESRSKRQVVILDCCFSGAFAKGMRSKDDESVDIRIQLGGEGRALLTSSTATQYSLECQGQDLSIYTSHLVNGIWTGDADLNHDGWISVLELHDYTCNRVQEAVPGMKPEIYLDREAYTISLSKAPKVDPALLYRKEVDDSFRRNEISFISYNWSDGVRSWFSMQPRPDVAISNVGRATLSAARERLGLTSEAADTIREQVLQPYREHQKRVQQYREAFEKEFQHRKPLNVLQRQGLRRLQQLSGLTEVEITQIEAEIMQRFEWMAHLTLKSLLTHRITQSILLVSLSFASLATAISLISDWRYAQEQQQQSAISSSPPRSPSTEPSTDASASPAPTPTTPENPQKAPDSEAEEENKGDEYYKSGEYLKAAEAYGRAIDILKSELEKSDSSQAGEIQSKKQAKLGNLFLVRANSYSSLRKYEQAENDYDKAIEQWGNDTAQAYEWRGYARLGLRKYQEAREDLKKAKEQYWSKQDQIAYDRVKKRIDDIPNQ